MNIYHLKGVVLLVISIQVNYIITSDVVVIFLVSIRLIMIYINTWLHPLKPTLIHLLRDYYFYIYNNYIY